MLHCKFFKQNGGKYTIYGRGFYPYMAANFPLYMAAHFCSHIWLQINLILLQTFGFNFLLVQKKGLLLSPNESSILTILEKAHFSDWSKTLYKDSTSSVHSNLSRYGLYYNFLSLLFDKDHLKLDSYSKIEKKMQRKKITRLWLRKP